ncbi:hypothetical protein QBC34DRAFT_2471 [Podospora aff. communis PSN243]|uniref:Uncharacterized protein n=1 Tax=Podospora aff. communis PSN243 TaxID=3040156 RepID=A0AAV9H5R7_9PEZI|nr:hypothetical protein QBC34DRAFT_2471 [Podospora aff. communis PSN243]
MIGCGGFLGKKGCALRLASTRKGRRARPQAPNRHPSPDRDQRPRESRARRGTMKPAMPGGFPLQVESRPFSKTQSNWPSSSTQRSSPWPTRSAVGRPILATIGCSSRVAAPMASSRSDFVHHTSSAEQSILEKSRIDSSGGKVIAMSIIWIVAKWSTSFGNSHGVPERYRGRPRALGLALNVPVTRKLLHMSLLHDELAACVLAANFFQGSLQVTSYIKYCLGTVGYAVVAVLPSSPCATPAFPMHSLMLPTLFLGSAKHADLPAPRDTGETDCWEHCR